jgi:hypothetical protein
MHLFLSWSGGRSHRLALNLKDWLECHFSNAGITAFVSSDIEKGSAWFPVVAGQLQGADAGVVCLTRQSLGSEWLLFEAGALVTAVASRHGEGRIFTYLLDLSAGDLRGPLAAYQSTVATREDTLRFVNGLLTLLGRARLTPHEFEPAWHDLHGRLDALEAQAVTDVFPALSQLFDRKTFTEPVTECMDQSWSQRYEGAITTRNALATKADLVRSECGQFVADLYRELLAQVDSYAMDLRALLFEPKVFNLTDDGRRAVPKGIETALERSRIGVHALIAQLTDARQQALVPDAFRFERAVSFAARKAMVHRLEREMDTGNAAAHASTAGERFALVGSDWTLDRILGYLMGERFGTAQDHAQAVRAARQELERIQASITPPTLMSLHYCLRWLCTTFNTSAPPADPGPVCRLVTDIRAVLDERGLDQGGQLRSVLADIEEAAQPPSSSV